MACPRKGARRQRQRASCGSRHRRHRLAPVAPVRIERKRLGMCGIRPPRRHRQVARRHRRRQRGRPARERVAGAHGIGRRLHGRAAKLRDGRDGGSAGRVERDRIVAHPPDGLHRQVARRHRRRQLGFPPHERVAGARRRGRRRHRRADRLRHGRDARAAGRIERDRERLCRPLRVKRHHGAGRRRQVRHGRPVRVRRPVRRLPPRERVVRAREGVRRQIRAPVVRQRHRIHRPGTAVRVERHRAFVRRPARRHGQVARRHRRRQLGRPARERVAFARRRVRRRHVRAVVQRDWIHGRAARRVERDRIRVDRPPRRQRHVARRHRRRKVARPARERIPLARRRGRGQRHRRAVRVRHGGEARSAAEVKRHRVGVRRPLRGHRQVARRHRRRQRGRPARERVSFARRHGRRHRRTHELRTRGNRRTAGRIVRDGIGLGPPDGLYRQVARRHRRRQGGVPPHEVVARARRPRGRAHGRPERLRDGRNGGAAVRIEGDRVRDRRPLRGESHDGAGRRGQVLHPRAVGVEVSVLPSPPVERVVCARECVCRQVRAPVVRERHLRHRARAAVRRKCHDVSDRRPVRVEVLRRRDRHAGRFRHPRAALGRRVPAVERIADACRRRQRPVGRAVRHGLGIGRAGAARKVELDPRLPGRRRDVVDVHVIADDGRRAGVRLRRRQVVARRIVVRTSLERRRLVALIRRGGDRPPPAAVGIPAQRRARDGARHGLAEIAVKVPGERQRDVRGHGIVLQRCRIVRPCGPCAGNGNQNCQQFPLHRIPPLECNWNQLGNQALIRHPGPPRRCEP